MGTGRTVNFRGLGQCLGATLSVYALSAAYGAFSASNSSGCGVLRILEWAGMQALQMAIDVTIWRTASAQFCNGADALPQLLSNGTHLWSLVCQVVAGF